MTIAHEEGPDKLTVVQSLKTEPGAKTMTILVVGGTGKVGTHLLRHLLEQKEAVRVLVRTPERAALVPPQAEVFVADVVEDPEAASAAVQGVEAVFMLNAVTPQETVEGLLVRPAAHRL